MKSCLVACGVLLAMAGGAASACDQVVVQAYAPAVIVSPLAVCHAPLVVEQRVVQQKVVRQQVVVRQRPRVVSQLSLSFNRVRSR